MNDGPDGPLWEALPKPVRFEFNESAQNDDSGHGWTWSIRPSDEHAVRTHEVRTIDVLVAVRWSELGVLPTECSGAIDTAGLSAVEAVLHMADPPRAIAITNEGLEHRHGHV